MSEIKTQAQLSALNKTELVALVLQIQESLSKKLEEIESQNKAAIEEAKIADVVELKAALERKETEVKTALASLDNAKKLLEEREGEILELNELLAKSEKNSKAEADVITVGKTSIRIISRRFIFDGRTITPEVLQADEQLVKALLEEKCSLIELVN